MKRDILNALLAAETMTARGVTVHRLPHDLLLAALAKYGRPATPPGLRRSRPGGPAR